MPLGLRQIVLMVHIARQWPKTVTSRTTMKLVDPLCDHPTKERSVSYRDSNVTRKEKVRDCHCWWHLRNNMIYFRRLEKRALIEQKANERWQLTAKGWHVLSKTKSSRVVVNTWNKMGFPSDYTISYSQRPEFQVLYATKME